MGTKFKEGGIWLHQGDAFKWLQRLDAESVDCFITDYPYESLEKHRAKGTTTRLKQSKASSNEWFGTVPNSMAGELLFQAFRVLKKDRHAYFFCDDPTSDVLKGPAFRHALDRCRAEKIKSKLTCWKRIVWDKMAMGMGYHYRARYEFILFFEKGKRKLNNLGIPDVLEVPGILTEEDLALVSSQADLLKFKRIRNKDAYPTEKPHELIQVLIENSCEPGFLVVDPFMGSGSTGEAAVKAQFKDSLESCYFWGNDISPRSIETATERLKPYALVAEDQ